MKPVGSLKKLLSFAVAAFALLGIVSAEAAPKVNKAVVRAVRGTAQYSTAGGEWKKLGVGTQLNEKSQIKTAPGANVDLFLGDNGPVVRVTEDTVLGLDKLTSEGTGTETVIETQLDLKNGRILGNVKKLAAASKYEIKTPTGVAGIRGTKYDISSNGRVTVVEGSVMVVFIVNNQATAPVLVTAGQTVAPPAVATQAPTVLPAAAGLLQTVNADIEQSTASVQISPRGQVSGTVAIAMPDDADTAAENFDAQTKPEDVKAVEAFEIITDKIVKGELTGAQAKEALKGAGFPEGAANTVANQATQTATTIVAINQNPGLSEAEKQRLRDEALNQGGTTVGTTVRPVTTPN